MKKITMTIGIPAFNEEQNIEAFILSVLSQHLENNILQEILVYSDASSDKTNEIVQKLSKKYPVIKLLKGKTRKGKYYRVNELFALGKSDVLVILDADIAMKGKDFLEKLSNALIHDKKALMTAAHVELVRNKGFIAKVIHTSFFMGDCMRLSVPGHDIAPNFHGAATAYRGSFVRSMKIPDNLSDPHLYIYLTAKKQNGFRYCLEAVFLQNPPTTMRDLRQLMERSIGKEDKALEKIFGREMILRVHVIPKWAKVVGIWKCFFVYPFYTPLAMILSFYFGRIARPKKVDTSPIWEINTSTKKPITYAK